MTIHPFSTQPSSGAHSISVHVFETSSNLPPTSDDYNYILVPQHVHTHSFPAISCQCPTRPPSFRSPHRISEHQGTLPIWNGIREPFSPRRPPHDTSFQCISNNCPSPVHYLDSERFQEEDRGAAHEAVLADFKQSGGRVVSDRKMVISEERKA